MSAEPSKLRKPTRSSRSLPPSRRPPTAPVSSPVDFDEDHCPLPPPHEDDPIPPQPTRINHAGLPPPPSEDPWLTFSDKEDESSEDELPPQDISSSSEDELETHHLPRPSITHLPIGLSHSPTAPLGSESQQTVRGWLHKRSPHAVLGYRAWQRRYFFLDAHQLRYYKTDDMVKIHGEIPCVTLAQVTLHAEDAKRIVLDTISARRVHLQAQTAREAAYWVQNLTQVIQGRAQERAELVKAGQSVDEVVDMDEAGNVSLSLKKKKTKANEIKEGYLRVKKVSSSFEGICSGYLQWDRRYLILGESRLNFYRTEKTANKAKVLETLLVKNIRSVYLPSSLTKKGRCCFDLVSTDTRYKLESLHADDCRRWIENLTASLQAHGRLLVVYQKKAKTGRPAVDVLGVGDKSSPQGSVSSGKGGKGGKGSPRGSHKKQKSNRKQRYRSEKIRDRRQFLFGVSVEFKSKDIKELPDHSFFATMAIGTAPSSAHSHSTTGMLLQGNANHTWTEQSRTEVNDLKDSEEHNRVNQGHVVLPFHVLLDAFSTRDSDAEEEDSSEEESMRDSLDDLDLNEKGGRKWRFTSKPERMSALEETKTAAVLADLRSQRYDMVAKSHSNASDPRCRSSTAPCGDEISNDDARAAFAAVTDASLAGTDLGKLPQVQEQEVKEDKDMRVPVDDMRVPVDEPEKDYLLCFTLYRARGPVSCQVGSDLECHPVISSMEYLLSDFLRQPRIKKPLQQTDINGDFVIDYKGSRMVKTSNTERFTYKSYTFLDTRGFEIICHEALQESPFTFTAPVAALHWVQDIKLGIISELNVDIEGNSATSKHVEGVDGAGGFGKKPSPAFLRYANIRRDQYSKALLIQQKLLRIYSAQNCSGLTFKPSTYKSDSRLRSVATNLHLHTWTVLSSVPLDLAKKEGIRRTRHHTTTVGAFAAHHLGFSNGGLAKLHEHVQQLEATAERAKGRHKVGKQLEAAIDGGNLQQRQEAVFCQSLSTMITNFCTTLLQCLSAHSTTMTSEKVNQLAQIKELGYLVQVESLLSTFGDETHMLTDMEWGVEQLGRVKIRLESDSGYANHDPQQQENQAEAEAKAAGATRSRSSRKERGNNLVDDRGLDMMEMLDQIQVHVNQLPKSLANFKQDKEFAYSIGVKNRSKSTGVPALWPCLVVLTLPSSVYRRLPATFLYDDPTTSQPALYEVFPCLITQGVNEMQSLASRIGNTDLQAEINMRGTHRLNMYCDEFVKFKIDVLGCRQPAELERLADLMLEADSLRDLAPNSGQTKNLSFLRMSDELVRAMQGSKVVCCKSAKDRTSMATTWRHARILGEFHNVSEDSVTKATALMRLHGVRRTNVFKNTGKWNYAFNALQRKTLPGLFRAPDECCGTAVS